MATNPQWNAYRDPNGAYEDGSSNRYTVLRTDAIDPEGGDGAASIQRGAGPLQRGIKRLRAALSARADSKAAALSAMSLSPVDDILLADIETFTLAAFNAKVTDVNLYGPTYLTFSVTLGTAEVHYIPVPSAGSVTDVFVAIDDALTTADETITFRNHAGTAMTDGVLTITQADSGAGDTYTDTATANNTFTAGQVLQVDVGGQNETAARANIVIAYLQN